MIYICTPIHKSTKFVLHDNKKTTKRKIRKIRKKKKIKSKTRRAQNIETYTMREYREEIKIKHTNCRKTHPSFLPHL